MHSTTYGLDEFRIEKRFTPDGISPTPGNSVWSEYDKVVRKLRQSVGDLARYDPSRHSPLVSPFPCTPGVHRSLSNELASLDLSLLSSRRSGQPRVPRRLIPIRSCESRSAIALEIEADLRPYGGKDDDVEFFFDTVAGYKASRCYLHYRMVHQIDVGAMQRIEPARIESDAFASQWIFRCQGAGRFSQLPE
jgi:hypothetical protein